MRYVVVCTDKRGVFGGELLEGEVGGAVELANGRMANYWSADVRGVVGLAATGPTEGCRITRPAPKITLAGVTAIFDCTPEAQAAWEAAEWK